MKFAKELRWSRHAEAHKAYIQENFRENRFSTATYVITEAAAPNLFEIYNAYQLFNPWADTEALTVIGIGYGYRDTLQLLQELVEERYR